jgi:hypothetical protein
VWNATRNWLVPSGVCHKPTDDLNTREFLDNNPDDGCSLLRRFMVNHKAAVTSNHIHSTVTQSHTGFAVSIPVRDISVFLFQRLLVMSVLNLENTWPQLKYHVLN